MINLKLNMYNFYREMDEANKKDKELEKKNISSSVSPEVSPLVSQVTNDERRYNFWNILERDSGAYISPTIKNILRLNNMDNPLSFRNITEDVLKEFEIFAQTVMTSFIEPNSNMRDYFGIFHNMPEKFRFMIGDRHLILELVKMVKQAPKDYWKLPSTDCEEFREPSCKKRALSKPEDKNILKSEKKSELHEKKNPNVKEEINKLTKLVKSLSQDENLNKKLRNLLKGYVQIEVSIKEIYDGETYPQGFTYVAGITCPSCSFVTNITKCETTKGKSSRWIISNFRRHIYQHQKSTELTEKRDKSSSNVLHLLQASAKSPALQKETNYDSNSDVIRDVIAEYTIVDDELLLSKGTDVSKDVSTSIISSSQLSLQIQIC
jgi:hypothetical protein